MLRSGLRATTLPGALYGHWRVTSSTVQLFSRTYAASASGSAASKGKQFQPPPSVIPFSSSPSDALAAFKQYQKDALFNLHAGDLLKADFSLEPAFLPFYLFDATISAEAIATLGRTADKSRKDSPLVWSKMSEWKQTINQLKLERSEWCMQVYASYRLRRDLAEAAKPLPATLAALSKTLTPRDLDNGYCTDPVAGRAVNKDPASQQDDSTASSSSDSSSRSEAGDSSSSSSSSSHGARAAASGVSGYSTSSHTSRTTNSSGTTGDTGSTGTSSSSSNSRTSSSSSHRSSSSSRPGPSLGPNQVPLDTPDMRQSIAWQLCHRQIMHQQILAAAEHLKQTMSADAVRDLQLRLTVHSRSVHLAYFPAYHLWYVHGEKYTPSRADIVPAEYDALIGGGPEARVAAELHPSPMKSRAAAAAAVTGVGLGAVPLTTYALGIDPGLANLAGADAVFLAFLAATSAGVIASRLPLMARNKHAAEQVEADRKFYRQFDQRESAHGAPPDEHTLWLWKDADWRKWEQDDKWNWQPGGRKLWAESLFRQQAQREIDRIAAAKQQEQQSQQREEEERKEAQREQKFGRNRRFTSHHHDESGAGARINHQQTGRTRRRRDFLGYYKALGINLEEASVSITADYIKSHYKAAALKLHPDKHVHADEATQKRAAERFRRLQLAYETLRDNDKRRAYDQGRLVQ